MFITFDVVRDEGNRFFWTSQVLPGSQTYRIARQLNITRPRFENEDFQGKKWNCIGSANFKTWNHTNAMSLSKLLSEHMKLQEKRSSACKTRPHVPFTHLWVHFTTSHQGFPLYCSFHVLQVTDPTWLVIEPQRHGLHKLFFNLETSIFW